MNFNDKTPIQQEKDRANKVTTTGQDLDKGANMAQSEWNENESNDSSQKSY